MRRIAKGAPPPNVSPPTQAARSLRQAEEDFLAGLSASGDTTSHARACFDSMHKIELRRFLLVEQRGLCVFCECEISESFPPPSIDHWNPIHRCSHDALNWRNLHLSCRRTNTCDDRKNNSELELPWPSLFEYEAVFGFTSGGNIYLRNDVELDYHRRQALELVLDDYPLGRAIRKSTLNLNSPALREARAAAIEDEEQALQDEHGIAGPFPQANLDARAAFHLGSTSYPGFISIRLALLAGTLGIAR